MPRFAYLLILHIFEILIEAYEFRTYIRPNRPEKLYKPCCFSNRVRRLECNSLCRSICKNANKNLQNKGSMFCREGDDHHSPAGHTSLSIRLRLVINQKYCCKCWTKGHANSPYLHIRLYSRAELYMLQQRREQR